MTTIINSVITNYITTSSYSVILDGVAVMVIGILLVLLVEKVMLDAYEGTPHEQNTMAFTTVILPLLFVMMIVIVLRMAQVLHL